MSICAANIFTTPGAVVGVCACADGQWRRGGKAAIKFIQKQIWQQCKINVMTEKGLNLEVKNFIIEIIAYTMAMLQHFQLHDCHGLASIFSIIWYYVWSQ